MTDLRSIVGLGRDSLRGITPGKIVGRKPRFEWIDPRTLFVEQAYQRDLTEASTTLIRKIVAGFSWARFKTPVCVRLKESGNILVCVDGQHTAIGAASHPDVITIPVMVVDASDVETRAAAFVGHNRDRIAVSQMSIYFAELASKGDAAQLIDRACKASGAKILTKSINLRNPQPAGSTIAVGTIRKVAREKGEEFLTRVLTLLTKVGRGPIKADEITAVALILDKDPECRLDGRLGAVVAAKATEQWNAMAAAKSAESNERLPLALASLWCREMDLRLDLPKGQPVRREPGLPRLRTAAVPKLTPRTAVPRAASTVPPQRAPQATPIPPKTVLRQPEQPVRQPEPPIRKAPPPPAPKEVQVAGEINRIVERNGVILDLLDRTLQHRQASTTLTDDGVRMVAMLARVMPAFLPTDRLASKVFGAHADAQIRLRGLVESLNPVLRTTKLEVREISKMGYMLADLGG